MKMIPLPVKLHAENFILTVEFEDGQKRQIDVRSFIGSGEKADEVKKSLTVFKTAYIDDDISITWKNGFSLDPDVVYEDGAVVHEKIPAAGSFTARVSAALRKSNRINNE